MINNVIGAVRNLGQKTPNDAIVRAAGANRHILEHTKNTLRLRSGPAAISVTHIKNARKKSY